MSVRRRGAPKRAGGTRWKNGRSEAVRVMRAAGGDVARARGRSSTWGGGSTQLGGAGLVKAASSAHGWTWSHSRHAVKSEVTMFFFLVF